MENLFLIIVKCVLSEFLWYTNEVLCTPARPFDCSVCRENHACCVRAIQAVSRGAGYAAAHDECSHVRGLHDVMSESATYGPKCHRLCYAVRTASAIDWSEVDPLLASHDEEPHVFEPVQFPEHSSEFLSAFSGEGQHQSGIFRAGIAAIAEAALAAIEGGEVDVNMPNTGIIGDM